MSDGERGGFEGGCLCGAVRYRVRAAPVLRLNCHCTLCRRAAAAPYVPWVTVAAADFAFTRGEPAAYFSSEHGRRRFCAACGTPLLFTDTHRPEWVDVTTCSADDPEPLAPRGHVWAGSKLGWVEISDGYPRYPGNWEPPGG